VLILLFQEKGKVPFLLNLFHGVCSQFGLWYFLKLCVKYTGAFDPELRLVLELATDSELYELERILFGPR
jgi:hypothetical protein